MSSLKIFVSNHLDSIVVENPLFCFIRGGAVFNSPESKSNMQGDDTGDNISLKNHSYCELTIQYWAWKNIDLDYYGFCHYRRYFSFNTPVNQKPDKHANVFFDFLDEKALNQIILDPKNVISKMAESPLAMTTPFDVRNAEASSVYDHYASASYLHSKDFDILLNVIHDISPEFDRAAKEHSEGRILYPCNMFIMKKDLFLRYCEWLFPILQECERRINLSDYNIDELRVIGHLGERCLGIFYHYLNKNEHIEAVFFQRLLIGNTCAGVKKIYPRFNDQVTAVTASNDFYIPYLAVMIQSLLEHSSAQNKYELYILHTDITDDNQKKVKALAGAFPNVFIEFYDMSLEILPFRFKVSEYTEHISNETFYRTLLHKVFGNYNKVLYLDCDMIIQADVAELFKADIESNLIGACIDGDFVGSYCSIDDAKDYTDKVLELQNPLKYFQGGVLLVNIEQFKKEFDDHWLANKAMTANYRWGDQDTFNVICQERVFFLDPGWNVLVQHKGDRMGVIKKCPFYVYRNYIDSRKDPKIIHYAGTQKPWDDPEMDFAGEFWGVARRSPFYEILLTRIAKNHLPEVETFTQTIKSALKKVISSFFPHETRRRRFLKKIYHQFRK